MAFWVVLLSLLLLLLFKKLSSLALCGGRRLQDERAELEWLQRTLTLLRARLRDAEQGEIKDESLVLWLQELKDVACDVEDVIDELEYEELRQRVEDGWSTSCLPPLNKVMLHKINEIRQRWEEIAKNREGLRIGDRVGRADQEVSQRRMLQRSSLLMEGEVFGRDKEKEEVIEFLLASDHENGPLSIAITGMGGLGKTTLAQLVYNDKRVDKHFYLRMWVCTTPDYDVVKLTREMLGSTDYHMEFPGGLQNLDVYQRRLVEKLKGKRFFLVIDNLWDQNHGEWQCLSTPLFHGEKGSRVLITTRDTNVVKTLRTRRTVELEGLQFHDCWRLFKRHAFVDGNSREYPKLEAIGKQIVEKFKGVPLAAITMGGLLYSKLEEGEWIRILESELWELELCEDSILSVLKLSYEHLPPQLKPCFAYCSLFPKGYKFDKFELVQQWMAQGYVHGGGRGRMEDVGCDYFDDLFSRSFFQLVDGKFVMHDSIHDLALFISQHDHSITEINGSHEILKVNHRLRHLSLLMTNRQPDQTDFDRVCRFTSLRTLAFFFPQNINFQIPHSLFLSLKTLRVLDLSCGGIKMLPDSVGSLIHLRYLDLRRNIFRSLPESLCCLYKLETLKLGGCRLESLPQGVSNLINLRHLQVNPNLLCRVVGIGKLTCLQELEAFPISEGHGIKIEDLKDMNELRGGLSIWGLHRVRSKEEAMRAMLNRKWHLHKLEMQCNGHAEDGNSELEVLEALVPPARLKDLAINGYDGVRCPSWMGQQAISKIESLCLSSCRNLNSLPPLGCLPFLKTIKISCCPHLRGLPSIPTTVRELTLRDVGLKKLPEFSESCDHICPSLSMLRIDNLPALKSLQQGLLRHHMKNLTVLSIQRCEQLVHWPEGAGFRATLLSLQEELLICDCPKLMALPDGTTLSASLKNLKVTDCPGVANRLLFAQLHNLSSDSIVHVSQEYADLACCSEEALQHLKSVDCLRINDVEIEGDDLFGRYRDRKLVLLECDKVRMWSWRCDEWVLSRRVRIRDFEVITATVSHASAPPTYSVPPEEWWPRRSPPASENHYHNGLISASIGEHHLPWASSLRWLAANGTLAEALISCNLASLEGLWISNCRGTKPLPTNVLPSHLSGLKELQIFHCPELTLPSLQELIWSLPSLQHLTIENCPNLSSSSSSSCSHSSVATSPLNAATLQTLFVDDVNLLSDAGFVRDQLSSLRGLHVWHGHLSSFTAVATEGLRSLGQFLQHLSFKRCPHLKHLPPDLRRLLPSLRALAIGECYRIQLLPEGGLPILLEILVIHRCRVLEPRCRPLAPGRQEGQQPEDWPKIAHIPVIVIGGDIVRGSYREFLELRAKWRDF